MNNTEHSLSQKLMVAIAGTAMKSEMNESRWKKNFGWVYEDKFIKHITYTIRQAQITSNSKIIEEKLQNYMDNTEKHQWKITEMREIASGWYV